MIITDDTIPKNNGTTEPDVLSQLQFLKQLYQDDNYGIGLFSVNDYILLEANPRYKKDLFKGYKDEECIGISLYRLIPEFAGSEAEKLWNNIVRTGKSVYLDDFEGKVGGMKGRYWQNTLIPIKYNGEVKYIVSLLVDITDKVLYKRQIEKQNEIIQEQNIKLEQQKELLESVIDNIFENVFVFNNKKEVVFFRSNFLNDSDSFHGIDDLTKIMSFHYMDGEIIPKEKLFIHRILHNEIISNEIFNVKFEGQDYYAMINGAPVINQNGEFLYGIITSNNITEYIQDQMALSKAQERLIQIEKEKGELLERASQVKDEFLSMVTHDFKTPLNVIISAVQAMEHLCSDDLTERSKGYINKIKQNSLRQLKLVDNLLDIIRINDGRIKLKLSNLDVVRLTKDIMESVSPYAIQKGIDLKFKSFIDKIMIRVDEEMYERILLNLLSNAIKFTPAGNKVSVTLQSKIDYICISIKDTGIGIPKDKQSLIFERFGQVESSLSRQAEGTGIGLSLVKMLVESLGGKISVKSEFGNGSVFTVLLPAGKTENQDIIDIVPEALDNRLSRATTIEFSDMTS